MYTFLLILHLLVSILLITVVLLQSGKSADLAGAFGGYGSQSSFGPRGVATFMSKFTTILAVLFMVITLTLMIMSKNQIEETASKGDSAKGQFNVLVLDATTKAPLNKAVIKYYQGDNRGMTQSGKDTQETKKAVSEFNKKVANEKGIAVINNIVSTKPIYFTVEAEGYSPLKQTVKDYNKKSNIKLLLTKTGEKPKMEEKPVAKTGNEAKKPEVKKEVGEKKDSSDQKKPEEKKEETEKKVDEKKTETEKNQSK